MSRRGRILFLAPQPFFQWRGSPIRVGFDLLALTQLGYEVDLLTLPIGEDKPIDGVRTIRVPNPFRHEDIPIGPSFRKIMFDGLLLLHALRLVSTNRYLAVHGVEDGGFIGVIAAGLARTKLVFEKHSDPGSYEQSLIMKVYRRVEAFTLRHANAIIATGPGLVEQARSVAPDTPTHHIFDIPSSLVEAEPGKVEEVRGRLTTSEGEVLIAYVGSFAVYQGIDLMFDAVVRVARQDARARFVIIGGTVGEIDERRRLLAAEGVEERVVFLGKIPPDELPHTLAAADILLSPRSAGTNTPLKLLDYLKAGGAIVATDNRANRLILNDDSAVLVQPAPGAFAEGILALLRDEERRERLSAAGRELVEKQYNFDEFKRRLRACYERL